MDRKEVQQTWKKAEQAREVAFDLYLNNNLFVCHRSGSFGF
jgi:hypothetical protein